MSASRDILAGHAVEAQIRRGPHDGKPEEVQLRPLATENDVHPRQNEAQPGAGKAADTL